MAKPKRPGVPSTAPAAPATAKVPAGGAQTKPAGATTGAPARKPAPSGGAPKNVPPPPPPPPAEEPAPEPTPEYSPAEYSAAAYGIAPGTPVETPDYGKYRDLREKAIRGAAEKRSWYDPLKQAATLARLGSPLAVPVLVQGAGTIGGRLRPVALGLGGAVAPAAFEATAAAGRAIGETIGEAATPEGRARLRYRAESALPDWEILGKSKGAVKRNPSGLPGREIVVYPNPSTVEIGGSTAEFAAAARQKERELKAAQLGFDELSAGYAAAQSDPTMPDAALGTYEQRMRGSLQRVADLRETLRKAGYAEEDIDAIK